MGATDPLLQPFQLRHLSLKNRILSTSHEPFYSERGLPLTRYRLYHEEKAKGGVAMSMIGGSAVIDRDSPQAFGNLHLWDDAVIPAFQELADALHRYDCAVMCQITHLGRRSGWNTGEWLPLMYPSPIREQAHRAMPKVMEAHDIRRVVAAYGRAAKRCRDGGLDGIEVEAYGHLMDAFWSPLTNRREDEYGGSLENRLRFTFEVLEEIRAQAGPDFIVGIRLVLDEDTEGGLSQNDGFEIARRLAAHGSLDFFNAIRGSVGSDEAVSHIIPMMGTPAAPHLQIASDLKKQIGLPVFHAARIADVATARHAIAEGHLDMVGMTRAHMADPHIVAKIERGEEDRIRPCVGAGYCIHRIYGEGEALCLHNPATGRERTMPHVIAPAEGPAKRAVVVGGGPAGLEAARVLGARGHAVTLFEAAAELGGQVHLAAKVPRRRELLGITDWLAQEVSRLDVDVRMNSLAEEGDVLALEPDVVVVATGGLPDDSFVSEGADLIISTWDILSGQVQPAETVLLYDGSGADPGFSCAEFLAGAGSALEYVTPERVLGPDVGGLNYPAYLKAFYDSGTVMTLNLQLRAVARDGNQLVARFFNPYNKSWVERRVDQVVAENGTLAQEELYFGLKAQSRNLGEVDYDALIENRPQTLVTNPDGRYRLFRVGDAVASRNIHAAIYDSLRLCKDI